MNPFNNVYPTLVECFGIVLIGYFCGRMNMISNNHANGIQIYISRVALPAIIFKSMVELDFSKVNWGFWFGILIAKSTLFFFVILLTLLVSKPASQNLGRAGLFAIFVTQSNDLALGLPLFDAIFKSTHPEYLQYIYLLIPVSLALLNPIGLLMLEFNKNSAGSSENNAEIGKCKLMIKTLKGIVTNPLIFMVVIGVVVNQIFTACNFDKQNWFLTEFLKVLSQSFGATALFYLGFSLVGNMKKYRVFDLIVPFLLVACKSLILPMMTRQTVFWFNTGSTFNTSIDFSQETSGYSEVKPVDNLPTFAFIYGTLPTAPTVAVFASIYNVEVEMIGTSMVLGTLLSAPIMFVSSKMMSMMKSAKGDVGEAFAKTSFDLGILSSICCLLLSLSTAIGEKNPSKVVFAFFIIGLVGSNIWTALLSYALFTVRCCGENYFKVKVRYFIYGCGLIVPIGISLALVLTESGIASLATTPEKNSFLKYMNHNKYFNWLHAVVLICSVVTTITCLILLQRCDKYCRCSRKLNSKREEEEKRCLASAEQTAPDCKDLCRQCKTLCQKQVDIEDLAGSITTNYQGKRIPHASQCRHDSASSSSFKNEEASSSNNIIASCPVNYGAISPLANVTEETFNGLKEIEEMTLGEYFQGDRHQLSRHIILTLFLTLFSILNAFLCFERLFGNPKNHQNGIFVEIEFLVIVCTFGQGFVTFSVFGFNKMFFNLISFESFGCLQPYCFARKVKLQPVDTLDEATSSLCSKFKAHHLEICRSDLVKDLRQAIFSLLYLFRFQTYTSVFQGNHFIDWLIEFGLANTRMDAVNYGNCLLRGRVIEHCVKEHYFFDLPYFYRFCVESDNEP
eukprot:gene3284-3766_t